MLRRTLLQAMAGSLLFRPVRILARKLQAPPFSTREIATLNAIAEVVLPSDLSAADRKRVVDSFVAWFVNYREGADMGHGYGSSNLRQPSGASPASRYPAQFAALDSAASSAGAATFATLPAASRREVIEKALNEPQPVNRLPAQPTGANLIADFMGSYFTSADAWDRAFLAEIRRDSCRTLDDSSSQPRAMKTTRTTGNDGNDRERRGTPIQLN
jgi:hypothetical protein